MARLDALGDVLLAGPAVRAVAAQAEVTMLCGPRGIDAARLLPGVSGTLRFAAPWIEPEGVAVSGAAVDGLVRGLRRGQFDVAVIVTSFHQDPLPLALLLRLAGVPRIGAICEDFPGSLLDVRHRVDDALHEVERALSLAGALGFPPPPGDDGRLALRDGLAGFVGGRLPHPPYVVVHPGASVPARAWPPDRHAALVERLAARGWPVVVTGHRRERALTARVAGRHGTDLGGRTDLAGLAAVLRGAAVVVAANTGPAHLAAAVGTPVVSLFAPTVPVERWRPWRVPHIVLGDLAIACAGCRARSCPVPGHPCLASVSPDDAVAAVAELGSLRAVAS